MESSEARTRSLIAGLALFGVGAAVGAGAAWLIMSSAADSDRGGGRPRSPPTVATRPAAAEDGRVQTSRRRYGDRLRGILAELEVQLTDAVDELVRHFSVSCGSDSDQTSKSSRKPSPRDDDRRPSESQLDGVAATQYQQVADDSGRNVNNSSASVTRRFFNQVDRLFEGSTEDRERALELLRAKEQQLCDDVNFVWRLSKATHFKSKIESQRDRTEEKRLAYLSRDLAARSLQIDPNSAAAHKWFAITTGVVGDFESPKVRIQTGLIFKEHVEKAIALNPKDPTNYYLLGRWCYGVYALSWVEKKLASTFFATLPSATVDDALTHFLKAEKMNPGMFKENLLFIGKCYVEKKDFKTAVKWLQQAAKVPVNGVDDESCQKEVNNMLVKYERHAEVTPT